jgi:hypothetical protein
LAADEANASAEGLIPVTDKQGLRDEINKRLTLNWLIQGAAQHAGMTFHHLVRDQINALDERLLRLYDQYALINLLQYWHLDGRLLLGSPRGFWRRAASRRRHPFFANPVLSRHGGMLAEASRKRACERCREKGLLNLPFVFSFQAVSRVARLKMLEAPHHQKLVELATQTASTVWGIPTDRLDAKIVPRVILGNLITPRSIRGVIFCACCVGYGHVVRRDDRLIVVSRGTNWQLVAKELVKGTADLVCLHGLNTLSDEAYGKVIRAADRVEFEPWMLQTGGELWRRLLAVIPPGQPLAEVLMHLAQLPPNSLQSLILEVIERPESAKGAFECLGRSEATSDIQFDDERDP